MTGAQATALTGREADSAAASAVKAMQADGRQAEARERYAELVGRHQRRASRIAFAGRTFEDVEVHIIPDSGLPGFPTGLLGLGLLDEERVLLDLGGGSLRLMQSA